MILHIWENEKKTEKIGQIQKLLEVMLNHHIILTYQIYHPSCRFAISFYKWIPILGQFLESTIPRRIPNGYPIWEEFIKKKVLNFHNNFFVWGGGQCPDQICENS